jgi:hypothetical protein
VLFSGAEGTVVVKGLVCEFEVGLPKMLVVDARIDAKAFDVDVVPLAGSLEASNEDVVAACEGVKVKGVICVLMSKSSIRHHGKVAYCGLC